MKFSRFVLAGLAGGLAVNVADFAVSGLAFSGVWMDPAFEHTWRMLDNWIFWNVLLGFGLGYLYAFLLFATERRLLLAPPVRAVSLAALIWAVIAMTQFQSYLFTNMSKVHFGVGLLNRLVVVLLLLVVVPPVLGSSKSSGAAREG